MTARFDENMKSPLQSWMRALELTAPIDRRESPTLPVLLESLAERYGATAALTDRTTSLSYRELADAANRHARWARERALAPGDVVCLLMHNCPDYLAIWIGLTRVGVVVALLNTNLTGEALAHSVNIVSPRYVIVAPQLIPALQLRGLTSPAPSDTGLTAHASPQSFPGSISRRHACRRRE